MSRRVVLFLILSCLGLAPAGLAPAGRCGHAAAGRQKAGDVPPPHVERDFFHWARLPVCIFVAAHGAQEQEWRRVTIAGFDEWVQATHGAVGYRLVASPAQAQITVRFAPTPFVPGRPGLVGLTTTFWTGPVLQSADVVLATGGKSPDELQTAAAHELGHALGIRVHSNDPSDLMFPAPVRACPPAHSVPNRDLRTLKRCYPSLFTSQAGGPVRAGLLVAVRGAGVTGAVHARGLSAPA